MTTSLLKRGVLTLAVSAAVSTPAWATNGYFTHGVGTHSKAMAGAGDASPSMAIDVANNPASGILVDEHLDVGLAIFSPRREYSVTDSQLGGQFGAFSLNGGAESDNNYFPIPYIAKNWHFSEDTAFTLAFYGRGGMNTEYPIRGGLPSASFDPDGPGPALIVSPPGTYGAGVAGVNLNQAFLELTYSFKVHEDVALGIAPVIAYQMFSAKGVATFAPYTKTYVESFMTTGMPGNPENLTDNGMDGSLGFGIKVGAIWNVTDRFALQAAYQSEMAMDEFDEYSDLFAQGGDFDIPATARVGFSFAATDQLKVHFDVEHTYYSKVSSVANPLSNVTGCPTVGGMDIESCLGGERGFGFGWDDVTVYQVGAEWTPANNPRTTWRVGYNYGEQPISDEDAAINILAPAVVEQHFTAGFSWDLDNEDQISVAIMYAPSKEVTGANFFDPTQQVSFEMDQWEVELAYTF